MKQSAVSRRAVLTSVSPMVPVWPLLPSYPDAAARVEDAVMELLEAARTAAADPDPDDSGIFADPDVRLAVSIFLRLLNLPEDDAYGFLARLQ